MIKYIVFVIAIFIFSIFACNSNNNDIQGKKMNNNIDLETATLGGGCFWCIEAVFQDLKGVDTVISGYTGGSVVNPTYEQVCSGKTGHAEVCQIKYNPNEISFEEILIAFFTAHDPTTLNRQGNDIGTQYRSAIFYSNETQKEIALNFIKKLSDEKVFDDKIVTEVSKLDKFYSAEDYHQNYFKTNPNQPYCQFIINPKVNKFKLKFKDKLKTK